MVTIPWGMNESGQLGLGRIDDVGMATPAITFSQEEDEAIITSLVALFIQFVLMKTI